MKDAPKANAPLAGARLLVLEDEVFIAVALELHLRGAGASDVALASTLGQARELVENRPFDVAILDVRLPDGESTGLATQLLGQGVAVIFHSGNPPQATLDSVPGAQFCAKPSTAGEMIGMVRSALDRARPSAAANDDQA